MLYHLPPRKPLRAACLGACSLRTTTSLQLLRGEVDHSEKFFKEKVQGIDILTSTFLQVSQELPRDCNFSLVRINYPHDRGASLLNRAKTRTTTLMGSISSKLIHPRAEQRAQARGGSVAHSVNSTFDYGTVVKNPDQWHHDNPESSYAALLRMV